EDEIRLAELPAFSELRQGRQVLRVAFRSAIGKPFLNRVDLAGGEPSFVEEVAVAKLRQPWWHVTLLRHFDNLLRVFQSVGVIQQTERSGLARAMTRRTMLEKDGSHVAVE